MEAALQAALARGRSAWPELAVADETFLAAVRAAVAGEPDPIEAIGELAIEDLYLAQACATGDRAALDAFAARCEGAILGSLRAMQLRPDVIDEVVQEVRVKLFTAPPKIATYSGRAALASWARTIATRTAIDRVRTTQATPVDGEVLDRVPDGADGPELAHFRRTYRAEFKESFETALASLEVRERNVLRHHFVDGLTTDEIGALYDVHKTTAFRWLDTARDKLSKRTRSEFQQRIHAMPSELESILRLVQSRIDLSLSRVL